MATKTEEFKNGLSHAVTNLIKKEPDQITDKVASWTNAYSKEHICYQGKEDKNGDEVEFSCVYHALIHSPALETLLQLEHSYSVAVKELMEQAEVALDKLQKRYMVL